MSMSFSMFSAIFILINFLSILVYSACRISGLAWVIWYFSSKTAISGLMSQLMVQKKAAKPSKPSTIVEVGVTAAYSAKMFVTQVDPEIVY